MVLEQSPQIILNPTKKIKLFNIPIDAITMRATLQMVEQTINEKKQIHHTVVNAGKIVLMQTEKELEKSIKLKNYYDNWENRVYAFYTDKNNIMLNFQSAKKLNADYVISRFPIKNLELKIICYKCNNSKHLFLYKIL